MSKPATSWGSVSKNATNWTKTGKNTVNWYGNSSFNDAVKLNSTTVTLDSSTVTLLGYTAGLHFYDSKNATNWTKI